MATMLNRVSAQRWGEVTAVVYRTEISEVALKSAAETVRLVVGDGGGTLALLPSGRIMPL